MSWNVIQPSFASGELSPSLFARVDIAKYHSGAALLRNMFVDYRSGVSSRSGTMFMIQAYDSAHAVRLIPFQTSVLTPYVMEFGQFYMRPSTYGNPVLETAQTIVSATNTAPATLTVPGNPWVNGDWIYISGMTGAIQFNNRYFSVSVSGSMVTLSDVNGNPIDARTYGTYTGGGTAARVFRITSPYAAADLQLLKFAQVANVMYLTHPSYPPYTLTFTSPTNWVFAAMTFGSTATTPATPTVTPNTTGSAFYAYEVTSVDVNGQESGPSPAGTNAAGGVNIGSTAGTITVTWPAAAGAVTYNVYKAEPSVAGALPVLSVAYGLVGFANGTSFIDSNISPDFSQTPPIANNPFTGSNYPGCCCFFQQRLYFAASYSQPQTFWASQPGLYNNFNYSNPTQEDDDIEGTLVSIQINQIKSMVPMPGGLLMLTWKGVWQLSASGGGLASTAAVTPINATATPQAYNGVSDVPPIVINQDVLYVQAKGSIVRDLQYNIYSNIYSGTDISIMSNHLFYNYQIIQWAYAEEPFKTVWCVRSDGQLLTLTYIKEQELVAWAHSDTRGIFTSICAVTENNVDAVYVAVQRPQIAGGYITFIERIADREFDLYGVEDAWCVDCGLKTSGATFNGTLYVINSGVGASGAVIFPGPGVFTPAHVGQVLRSGGGIMTITRFINSTEVAVNITQAITQVLPDGTPIPQMPGAWSIWPLFTSFFGLDHLNGQTVSILADGNVIQQQVVANGTVTLPQPASKVVVGLPFTVQVQTMPLDLNNENDSIQGKRKKISALTVRCRQTRGVQFGHTFDRLSPMKEFGQSQILGSTVPLVTGDERVIMDPLWDVPGQICLEVDDPLPLTLLGVIPEITVGDTGKG